jgi:hypothetical protein
MVSDAEGRYVTSLGEQGGRKASGLEKKGTLREDPITLKGGRKMIRISKQAIEKLKGAHKNGQKNGFRLFISGLG